MIIILLLATFSTMPPYVRVAGKKLPIPLFDQFKQSFGKNSELVLYCETEIGKFRHDITYGSEIEHVRHFLINCELLTEQSKRCINILKKLLRKIDSESRKMFLQEFYHFKPILWFDKSIDSIKFDAPKKRKCPDTLCNFLLAAISKNESMITVEGTTNYGSFLFPNIRSPEDEIRNFMMHCTLATKEQQECLCILADCLEQCDETIVDDFEKNYPEVYRLLAQVSPKYGQLFIDDVVEVEDTSDGTSIEWRVAA